MSEGSQRRENVPSKFPQYVSSVIAGLSGFAIGLALCPLAFDTSYREHVPSNCASTVNLYYVNMCGAIVGTLMSGWISDYLGPKRAIQISAFPLFMSRLIMAYCRTVYGFYAAMALNGFAAGISLFAAITYCIDIAERRQRGSVAFMYCAFQSLGIICAQCLDSNVDDFILQALIPSVVPVIYLTALSFIPESPVHMCMKDDFPQACSSLQWLRGAEYDIDEEMARIRKYTGASSRHLRSDRCCNYSDSSDELPVKFATRKTAVLVLTADALFAVVYILHWRSVNRLHSFHQLSDEEMAWTFRTNEFKFPMILLLMWLVRHVELGKLILAVFLINAFGSIFVEVALHLFENVNYIWIPCLVNVTISYGNILLVILLLWNIFDNIVLKSKAIPLCLTMQIFWTITCTIAPDYQIPSIYLTAVNVFVGFIVIKYFLANTPKRKYSTAKTIFIPVEA